MRKNSKRFLSLLLLLMMASASAYFVYKVLAGVSVPPLNNKQYILPLGGRIAFVEPVFTATAYKPNGFYTFYSKHGSIPNGTYVTTDLNLLNLTVLNSWGWSEGLHKFITSNYAKSNGIVLGNNSFIITDIDVNNGALFTSNSSKAYDVVVVGFDEYVTDAEYNEYVQFVHAGGRLVLLDADNFYVQVNYNPTTNRIQLVDGHFYSFNGTAVTSGSTEHYRDQNALNFGSVYKLFKTEGYRFNGAIVNTTNPISIALRNALGQKIITTYRPHEENALANLNDQVIAYWDITNLPPDKQDIKVAAYELDAGNGSIIHTCIFGSDIIDSNRDLQLFLLDAIGIRNPHPQPPLVITVDTDRYVYSVGSNFTIFGNISASVIVGAQIYVQVVSPNGSTWAQTPAPLNSDGSFYVDSSTNFRPLDQLGNYTVYASYNGVVASSNFTVIAASCNTVCDT